jgi:hypothetical protein
MARFKKKTLRFRRIQGEAGDINMEELTNWQRTVLRIGEQGGGTDPSNTNCFTVFIELFN